MIILAPEDSLRITCSASGAVVGLACYTDKSGTQNAPGSDLVQIADTTPTALTTVPAVSFQKSGEDRKMRHVHHILVANTHASTSQTIIVDILRGGDEYQLVKATVAAGAKIQFNEGNGWT